MGVYLAFMFFAVSVVVAGIFIGWSMARNMKSEADYNTKIIIDELQRLKNKINSLTERE